MSAHSGSKTSGAGIKRGKRQRSSAANASPKVGVTGCETDAAKALRDRGTVPPGVDDPTVYAVRSGGVILPRGVDWVEATRRLRTAGVEHPGLSRSVLGGVPAV